MPKLFRLYELLMEVKKAIFYYYKEDKEFYNKLNRNLMSVINLIKEKRAK